MGCTQSNNNDSRTANNKHVPTSSGNVARRRSQFESSSTSTGGGSNKQLKRRQSSNTNLGTTGGTMAVFREETNSSSLAKPPSNPQKSRKPSITTANLPKCKKCNDPVTALEQAKDSKGTVFHAVCLKCSECGVKLAARECVSASATRLTSSQYVIEDSNKLFCDRHAPMADKARRKNSIKGQDITEKAVDEKELKKMGSNRRELNEKAKEVLEESGGFSSELKCGRCGSAITSSQQMTVSGMMRYHQVCPSKEEISKADKSVKYFLEKIPDRLAAVLTCDAKTKKPHTFLYIRNPVSYKEALKQATSGMKQVAVVYDSDVEGRDQIPKNFAIPTERSFDIQLKGYSLSNFSFESPPNLLNDARTKLGAELEEKKLKITKQGFANGVVHTLEGYFHYDEKDENGTPLTTEKLILLFERPAASNDDEGSDGVGGGPLAALRLKRRGTSNKSTATTTTTIEDDDALTAGSNNSGSTVHTMARRMTNQPQTIDTSSSKLERYDSNSIASASSRYLSSARSASSGLALNRYDSSSSSVPPSTSIPSNPLPIQNGLSPMQNAVVDANTDPSSLDTSSIIASATNPASGTSPGRSPIPISPNKVVPPPLPKNKPKVREADMNVV